MIEISLRLDGFTFPLFHLLRSFICSLSWNVFVLLFPYFLAPLTDSCTFVRHVVELRIIANTIISWIHRISLATSKARQSTKQNYSRSSNRSLWCSNYGSLPGLRTYSRSLRQSCLSFCSSFSPVLSFPLYHLIACLKDNSTGKLIGRNNGM